MQEPVIKETAIAPQAIEAEIQVLGGILLDQYAFDRVCDVLKPEYFYSMAHGSIFRAMNELWLQQEPIGMTSVALRMHSNGTLQGAGGQSILMDLCDRVVSAVNIDYYAKIVCDRYQRRRLLEVSTKLHADAIDIGKDLISIVEETQEQLFNSVAEDATQLEPMGTRAIAWLEELQQRKGKPIEAIPTGLGSIDEVLQGGVAGDQLIVVAGRPSMGKTQLALNIAYNVACVQGLPVAIFSLEMSTDQVIERIVAAGSGVNSSAIRKGDLKDEEWASVSGVVLRLQESLISINDTPSPSIAQIRVQTRQFKQKCGGLGLVLIDYLQLMSADRGRSNDFSGNRNQEISTLTRNLKILARDLGAPVMVISQLSRAVESRQDKRPMLSDLRDSGSVEQDADIVALLYRDDYYNPNSADRGIAEVNIAKQRNGPTKTVRLLFEKDCQRFTDADRPSQPSDFYTPDPQYSHLSPHDIF